MEAVTPGGAIGALAGLVVGLIEYRIVGGAVVRKLRDTDRSKTPAEKAEYERRIQAFRGIFLVMTLGMSLVAGYFLGRGIAG